MHFTPPKHSSHQESLWRFLALATLLIAYFVYMSWKFDAATGAWIALLSWSFFVLCTPVADGGFIIAFPVRLLFGSRMLLTQTVVWIIAIAINLAALTLTPVSYSNTALTRLLFTIITTPWPYWTILAISAVGTGLSIWFADEMMDVTSHDKREKYHKHGFNHKVVIIIGLSVLTVLSYYHLLNNLGVALPS